MTGDKYSCIRLSLLGSLVRNANMADSTKDGIDIRREDDTSCLVQSGALGSNNLVTFPIVHLNSSQSSAELGDKLIQLWEAETGLHWSKSFNQSLIQLDQQVQLSDDDDNLPLSQSLFTGPGRGIVRANWKKDRLGPYNLPPKPSDDMWLISQFLNTQWPMGGTMFVGVPGNWPERQHDNIWTLLKV